MATTSTLSRSLHDVGLATWFGGTLANAVALNPAAGAAKDASSTGAVANAGWDRWTPVNGAAMGATAYSRVLGRKVSQHDAVPAESGTEPNAFTPEDAAGAQRQLRVL